jgi:hypothetical protein
VSYNAPIRRPVYRPKVRICNHEKHRHGLRMSHPIRPPCRRPEGRQGHLPWLGRHQSYFDLIYSIRGRPVRRFPLKSTYSLPYPRFHQISCGGIYFFHFAHGSESRSTEVRERFDGVFWEMERWPSSGSRIAAFLARFSRNLSASSRLSSAGLPGI